MKYVTRLTILMLVVLLTLSLTLVSAQEDSALTGPLQQLLDQQVEEQGILGMAMIVQLADGTVVGAASGYSDPDGEEDYTIETRTLVGSITKTFTAVVVIQLVEEGELSLDDTIDAWFPEQPDADIITIQMLLSHNSGVNDYLMSADVDENSSEEWDPLDLIAAANVLDTADEVGGDEGNYSNTNYIMLGLIIEDITGNDWSEEVEERVIEPLELTDTEVVAEIDEDFLESIVGGYMQTDDGYLNLLGVSHPSVGWSAGAMTSTPADLNIYVNALFNGDLFESSETIDQMLQPITSLFLGDIPANWGLGMAFVDLDGLRVWWHDGYIDGNHAFIGFHPETGTTIVTTLNTNEGSPIFPSVAALQFIASAP